MIRRLALAALILAGIVAYALAALALVQGDGHAEPAPAVHAAPQVVAVALPVDTDGAFLAELAPGADLSAEQRADLPVLAENTCDAWTAGVPYGVTLAALINSHGFGADDAVRFLDLSREVYCPIA